MLKNVYVGGCVRTPFGSFNGSLSSLTAPQLGSLALRESLSRAGVSAGDVDEVIFGNVVSAGIGQNVARQASIGAGLPVEIGAVTINKVCGSGMKAIMLAAQAVQCGDAELIAAGGCESMSNAPYLLTKARTGYRLGHGELVDSVMRDGLLDAYSDRHMAHCGDLCATKYDISREAQDDYAIESYNRAFLAWEDGFHAGGTISVEVKTRKGSTLLQRDEDVAKFQGPDKLRNLPSAFGPDSLVTAGNASGINDGAAATMVFGDAKKKSLGLKPLARIVGYATASTEPDWFTIAPVMAIRKLCERIKVSPGDVDLFEINEAFALVPVLAQRELKLDPEQVNVVGGAVSIGHPIGATGARIVNTLARLLAQREKRLGIASICLGGGEATAIALERCE